MLLKLLLLCSTFYCQFSFAVNVSFYDGCHPVPLIEGNKSIDIKSMTVGDLTIEMLEKYKIPYKGTESGLNSFFNSPIGLDALEALSDTKLRAYGPCYMLDGKIMAEMPNEVRFLSQESKLVWFLGYATYESGVWENYCVPSHMLRSKFICGEDISNKSVILEK